MHTLIALVNSGVHVIYSSNLSHQQLGRLCFSGRNHTPVHCGETCSIHDALEHYSVVLRERQAAFCKELRKLGTHITAFFEEILSRMCLLFSTYDLITALAWVKS